MPLALSTILIALASAGTILGHLLAYAATEPDHARRAHLLAETGHHHFSLWTTAAFAVLVAALAHFAFTRSRETSRAEPLTVARFSFTRLMAMQLLLFVGLEVTERALAGGDLTPVLSERPVLVGLALQIVSALFVSWKLYVVSRVVDVTWKPKKFAGDAHIRSQQTNELPPHIGRVSTPAPRAPPVKA